MKMKTCIAALLLLCAYGRLQAQTPLQPLQPGDTLPDVALANLVNTPATEIRLSAYKGKIILLDFWATWCSPCVKSMPKLNALQQEFKDRAVIIPVTYQSADEVNDLFKHMPAEAKFNMPAVLEDTLLQQLFPYTELPHYIWIDAGGIVRNITGGEAVTADNINRLASNSTIAATVKQDIFTPVDRLAPLFIQGNGGTPAALKFYSVFTGYQPGLSSLLTREPLGDTGLVRLTAINVGLVHLCRMAYAYNGELSAHNRTLLEVKNKNALVWNEQPDSLQAWMQQHTWCYELILPSGLNNTLQKSMQFDLDRLFPAYTCGIETRKVKCLVLTATEKAKALITTAGNARYERTAYSMHMEHGFLTGFTNLLSVIYLQNLTTPVINGTGITLPVNLDIEANLSDVASLRKALQPLGLDLTEQERDIEMIVIKDR